MNKEISLLKSQINQNNIKQDNGSIHVSIDNSEINKDKDNVIHELINSKINNIEEKKTILNLESNELEDEIAPKNLFKKTIKIILYLNNQCIYENNTDEEELEVIELEDLILMGALTKINDSELDILNNKYNLQKEYGLINKNGQIRLVK